MVIAPKQANFAKSVFSVSLFETPSILDRVSMLTLLNLWVNICTVAIYAEISKQFALDRSVANLFCHFCRVFLSDPNRSDFEITNR